MTTAIYSVYWKDAKNNSVHAYMSEEEFKAFNEPTVYGIVREVWLTKDGELIALVGCDYIK